MRAWIIIFLCWIAQESLSAPATQPWSNDLLRDVTAWPHAETDLRLTVVQRGLRVEIPAGRKWTIAARSQILLPREFGRISVRLAEIGGGAKWFVRVYGEVREPGKRRTIELAQDEAAHGDRVFDVDPRLRTLPDRPLQLQLGVEGPPGAFAVFEELAFLPALKRANRSGRQIFQPGQKDIAAVELMPNLPEPFELLDWREKARAYDRFVFDFNASGEFLPLVWLDESRINIDRPTFGLPSYVGTPHQAAGMRNSQEGITCMGAVLGATLAGIDKSRQERDYVAMCEAWFNSRNGMNLVLNRQEDGAGGSFWYELFPHIVFSALADRYPDKPRLAEIQRIAADRWRQACLDLVDQNGVPDFNHTSFDFRARKAVDNGKWREPDAAAAVAWLEYSTWMKSHDPGHLAAADACLRFLQGMKTNPYYEVLLPFGAITAARMNAELGRAYDIERFLNWCFGISDCRGGWGVIVGNWGVYDCDGLLGSIDNRCGYAFAMNTFAQAGALAPLPRYDARYARAIGKWMLNLANSSRLFYPGSLPPGHESSGFWKGDPQHVIAYEGLRYDWLGKRPCATGDPVLLKWGPKTDLGLYGSSYVGMLGAVVRSSNVPRILQLDCLATDFFRGPAYPTYLYFNPYDRSREVTIELGPDSADLYDAAAHRFVDKSRSGRASFAIPPDSAVVLVVTPARGALSRDGRKLLLNGVVIDFCLPD